MPVTWVRIPFERRLDACRRDLIRRQSLLSDPRSGSGQHLCEEAEIDLTPAGELFGSGCCGGSNPSGFFWFRRSR